MTTLEDALKRHRGIGPGFHMLRHLLSLLILAHHCRVAVFGVHFDDSYAKGAALTASVAAGLSWGHLVVELLRPGLFALVGMFFALSGFLVVGSALRTASVRVFFANRALRILPALSVEVTLSAFILGPLVTSLPWSAYFSDGKFFAYFGNIVGEVTFLLPGVFLGNPWPQIVNANLWTLPSEFWCYLFMLALLGSGLILRHRWITLAVLAAAALWLGLEAVDGRHFSIRDDSTHFTKWYIVMMFFFGTILFTNAKRVVLHPLLFVASAGLYYGLTLFDRLGPLSGICLAYCTVYIGMLSFAWFDRLLPVDLSYGIYLYGFPITQAVIFFLLPHLAGWSVVARFLVVLPLVVGLTAVFSYVSWTYIEKPALALRRHLAPRRAPVAAR